MATETELERMLIRLVGDASDYVKMLRDARKATEQAEDAIKEAGSKIEQIQEKLKTVGDRINTVGDSMLRVGGILSISVTTPIVGLGTAAFAAATKMEGLKLGLTATLESAELMEEQLKELKEVAKLPGLGLEEAVQGAISLQQVGFEAERTIRILKAFGNAVATTGGGRFELGRILLQLTQMQSAGKVLTADLRPILQTAPLIGRAMKEAFGTISAEAIGKANISAEEFIDTLLLQLEKMPQVAGGTANTMENLGDSIKEAMVEVGNTIVELVLPAINQLATMVVTFTDKWRELSPEIKKTVVVVAALVAGIGPLLVALGTFVKMIGFAVSGLIPLAAAMGPIGLLGALVALISTMAIVTTEMRRMKEAAEEVEATISGIERAVARLEDVTELERAISRVDMLREEYDKLRAAFEEELFLGFTITKRGRDLDDKIKKVGDALVAANHQVTEVKKRLKEAEEETARVIDTSFAKLLSGVVEKVTSISDVVEGLTIEDLRAEFDALAMAFEAGDISAEAFKESIGDIEKRIKAVIEATERSRKEWERIGDSITERFKTPLEKLHDELMRINSAFEEGVISVETYERAVSDVVKRIAEIETPKVDIPRSRAVGATGGAFTVSGVTAVLGGQDVFARLAAASDRRTKIAEEHKRISEFILAETREIRAKPPIEVTRTRIG